MTRKPKCLRSRRAHVCARLSTIGSPRTYPLLLRTMFQNMACPFTGSISSPSLVPWKFVKSGNTSGESMQPVLGNTQVFLLSFSLSLAGGMLAYETLLELAATATTFSRIRPINWGPNIACLSYPSSTATEFPPSFPRVGTPLHSGVAVH